MLKVFLWILVILLFVMLSLVLFIRSPWGQQFIVEKATTYVSGKTNTGIEIGRLFITFRGNIHISGLYLEDENGDTLVYSNKLETGIQFLPLIRNGDIKVSKLEWDGLYANVFRSEEGKFNFDFLIDAFVSGENGADFEEKKPEKEEDVSSTGFPDIGLGPVSLTNFDLKYRDELLGMDTRLGWEKINLDVAKLDLNKMNFHIRSFGFYGADISYEQFKPFSPTEEDTTSEVIPMPAVILDELILDKIKILYDSKPDSMLADVLVGKLVLEMPEMDLEKNKILIKTFQLLESDIFLQLLASPGTDISTEATDDKAGFEWPDWDVEIGNIALLDNDIRYQSVLSGPTPGYFDPNNIQIENFRLNANNIFAKNEKAGINLEELTFEEQSGFGIRNFTFKSTVSNTSIELSDFNLVTRSSEIQTDLKIQYKSIDRLMEDPKLADLDWKVDKLIVDIADAFYFAPELREEQRLKALAGRPINGQFELNGGVNRLNIAKANIWWGEDTYFNLEGWAENLLDMDRLRFEMDSLELEVSKRDLFAIMEEQDLGFQIPEQISLRAMVKGSLDDVFVQSILTMPEGEILLDGNWVDKEQMAFEANIQVKDLQLDRLLENDQLGDLGFRLEASGHGTSINDLNASLSFDFDQLEFNDYDFKDLKIDALLEQGKGEFNLVFQDENLDVSLLSKMELDSANSDITLHLDLKGADLLALGYSSEELRVRLDFNSDFSGNLDAFSLKGELNEGTVVYENRSIPLGQFDFQARINEDSTSFDLNSDLLETKLRSNAAPDKIVHSLTRQFQHYFDTLSHPTDSLPVVLDLQLTLRETQVLSEIFLDGLEQLDDIRFKIDYRESDNYFRADLDLPFIQYNDSRIDSMGLRVLGESDSLRFAFGLVALESGPLSIGRTYFRGDLEDNRLMLDFNSFDGEERLVHVSSDIGYNGDTLSLHIDPNDLILNKREWEIPDDNEVLYAGGFIDLKNFVFRRSSQQLAFRNEVSEAGDEQLGIVFEDFRLATFTSFLNPDELIATGFINGEFIIENIFGATGLIADLEISELHAMQVLLGNLSLDAKSVGTNQYDFSLMLKDGGMDLDLIGDYRAAETGANLNLELSLNEIKMEVVEGLSFESISDARGYISGQINVSGTTVDPEYEGTIRFNGAAFTVNTLNSAFTLADEVIKLDNQGVFFNGFTIMDQDNNTFKLDGSILTTEMTNPSFDLKLDAKNFRVLNSTREDNDLFFGNANIDAGIDIKGDLNLPRVEARMRVNSGTDLTFIVPETQLDIVERDGVVLFVNRQDPDDILTKRTAEMTASGFTGYQVSAILEVDPNSVFNVIVDERSGDNLQIAGEANLSINLDPNGRITLSGGYELSKGHYEMSLYSLVSRRFEIDEGSTITWGGDPMDAQLDISAIYRVRTSASELMVSQTAGVSADVANQYRQELPFLVFLNVKGELLRPQISFRLDMPEEQRGALGGNVYSRVQQLNEQEDDLNRQVFSLLVLNRFFPESGSDGSGGGTAAIARSSVSQVLSGQLNTFSDNLLGDTGLELDFDLDSFTDYQSGGPQDRTQLNVSARKRLFDDRLIVQVGSQIDIEGSSQNMDRGNALLGNVSLEYLLTENGRYRLRGFRRNQFESIIDGQLVVTGLSLIFNREFNEFRELWSGIEEERRRRNTKNPGNEREEGESENNAGTDSKATPKEKSEAENKKEDE